MSRPTHDRRRSAAWLTGDMTAGARFHTGPIGPSHPALAGLEGPARRTTAVASDGAEPPPAALGVDHREALAGTTRAAMAPTVQEFPDADGPVSPPEGEGAAVREPLTGALPEALQTALAALDPALRERVLTSGMAGQTGSDVAALVRRNLETVARQVVAALPSAVRNSATKELNLDLARPVDTPGSRTHVASLCRFLEGVAVPDPSATGKVSLTAGDRTRLQANLAGLSADRTRANETLARLPAEAKGMVMDLLNQGLLVSTEVLAIMTPDGNRPADMATATSRLMQGLADLVRERLQLTAADTFQPPIGEADAQGSSWQPQQLVAIAHTVLQGLRDGMAGDWEGLRFRLEVPQMPDGATLLDRDIGAMRYGHFDQVPGQPPTMVLSALDSNPEASRAVQGAWRQLWGEISSGRHYLGNGDPTAQTMATMLQGYLQEQQIDLICQRQRPVVRALTLHVEEVAAHGSGPEQDFAARLLTSSSGLRSDAIANLWAMHQLARTAQDTAVSGTVRSQALLRLRDFLGTVNRTGPEADMIRQYLGADLARLDPGKPADEWLAAPNGRSQRQNDRVVLRSGDNLTRLLERSGGGRGPEAILQFLRLNRNLSGSQAITVSVPDEHARRLGLTGPRVAGAVTFSAADFVTRIEEDRKLLSGLETRFGLQRGPRAEPGRTLTIAAAEARRIGHFSNGRPNTAITAQRLWELVQLAKSRSDDAVRYSNVHLMTGATVEMPPRTWNFSANATRQMEIDNVDARSQMLAFVSRRMEQQLLATPRATSSLAQDIGRLERVDVPLQEDGRFGQQTQRAMQRLEQESGMQNGFDPTTWYRHMLRNAMPPAHDKQNFWVGLTTHEMIGHGTEAGLLRTHAEPLAATLGSDEAYAQTFQFWGYGVFGFLNGQGEPPRPGEEDALSNDPRTVAAHATVGTESLADGMYTFNPSAGFITPYAKSSPAEAWAESMRFFTQRPDRLLRESPAAFLFINAVSGRYKASQIMAMASTASVFGTESAARSRLGQAIEQLVSVRHTSINPAVVRQFASNPAVAALRDMLRGGTDQAAIDAEPLFQVAGASTATSMGRHLVGPEQRAMDQLLDDPDRAAAFATAMADRQPMGDDPTSSDNGQVLAAARTALIAAGLSETDVTAIPSRTLLRWVTEANDMVTLAHIRQFAERAHGPSPSPDDTRALDYLLRCLWSDGRLAPQDAFPPGVWTRTSPALQDRLTEVLFLSDLRGAGQALPQGTYNLTMNRPGDLVDELGQVRLATRRQGLDRLQNQLQSTIWSMTDGSVSRQVGGASIGRLIPQIRTDLADNPRLAATYREYLDRLEASLQHYRQGGQNPPPAGMLELYDTTPEGIAAALEQTGILRQQLSLGAPGGGRPETATSSAR